MAGQSDPHVSLLSAEEVEFMDEDEMIEIVPNIQMDPLNFICGDFGPFLPHIATQVPLWLAVALKKRGKCTIRPPQWMSVENLKRVLEGERDSKGAFQILPFHYVEISGLLFDHAHDDIPDMYVMRSLIEDIRDVRIHKVETRLECLVEQPQSYCKGAEVLLNLQATSSVAIQYHPLFGPHDDLILLELDEKILSDVLYHRITLRGQPDEDAVLCTKSKTYSVKFVGTSNSVFLVPPADYSRLHGNRQDCDGENYKQLVAASVIKVAPGNMELVEVAPRLDKLKSILSENLYGSDDSLAMEDLEFMERSKRRLYTWDDLTNKVQASDDELRTGLQALSAVEIDGYWRIVDEKYMGMILRMLLHNSVLNDWPLGALIEDKVVNVLESDGFPCKLAYHCLNAYGSRLEEAMDGGVWRMDARRVCVHFARGILREGKRKMESFMEEWLRMIPEEMQPSFDMLEGEVLTEKVGVETWVYAFSVSSLPSTPAERFSILFKERPKWEWKDLEPYIRDLYVPGLSSEALLLKYTRRTQPNIDAAPVFSAR